MSKKHFNAIAASILDSRETVGVKDNPVAQAAITLLVFKLCADFAGFNANFDEARFLAATGTKR